MEKKGTEKSKASANAGISMVLVVVMLMVFFILGAAVLAAGASTTAAASRRTAERQAYYYARSALDVLDESLQKGKLGEALKEDMRTRLGSQPELRREVTEANPLKIDLALSGVSDLGVVYEPATLSYTGIAKVQTGNPNQISLQLKNLLLTVKATYKDQTYTMRVQYRYTGWAAFENNTWKWSEDGWTVQQVG